MQLTVGVVPFTAQRHALGQSNWLAQGQAGWLLQGNFLRPMRSHPCPGVGCQQLDQRNDAFGVAGGQAHYTEQCQKARYRRGDLLGSTGNPQANQSQQAL
ncbi:hypothetical protein D3C81_1896660 [compost metagenome]